MITITLLIICASIWILYKSIPEIIDEKINELIYSINKANRNHDREIEDYVKKMLGSLRHTLKREIESEFNDQIQRERLLLAVAQKNESVVLNADDIFKELTEKKAAKKNKCRNK